MGCNCKGTTKGIPNRSQEKWLAMEIYELYKQTIGNTTVQYFTTEQRNFVRYKYYEVYPNSKEVDYKQANNSLLNVFRHHQLI